MSLPDDDFAERSRSIFERLRAAQGEHPDDAATADATSEPDDAAAHDVAEATPSPTGSDAHELGAAGDEANDGGEPETVLPADAPSEVVAGESQDAAVAPPDEVDEDHAPGISDRLGGDDLPRSVDLGEASPEELVPDSTEALEEAHVVGGPALRSGDEDGIAQIDDADALALPEEPGPPPVPPGALPDPARFVRPLPRILAIANQKGGVGKTTTTVNLGASLAVLGYRVLVIDLDPQGNATTGLGINSRNLDCSIYDVILHDTPLEDCVEPTTLRNLFVAPATIDLAGAEIELVPAFSREQRLKRALEDVRDDYEFVLIDCPPSLGLLTVNALSAASEVVVPIQCEYYALEGLGQLLRNINLVQSNLNPTLELSAIVLTMYDARTKLAEQVADEVRQHFGDRVCRNVVPRTVRLSEAPSFGQPIIVFDPSSRGALAYRELAKEVSGGAPQRAG